MASQLLPSGLRPALALLLLTTSGFSQDIVPRRWSHLPVGSSVVVAATAYTSGKIYLDPDRRIEDVEVDLRTLGFNYIHNFRMLGKTARIDVIQSYQKGVWTGLVNGEFTAVKREGWTDLNLRYAINLYGAPPLSGKEYIEYGLRNKKQTLVGAGFIVQLPTGQYYADKLINLGSNRVTFRPQVGIVHRRGKLAFELTSTAWFYTDNDEFFGGTVLKQHPSIGVDAHVIYSFRPGLWVAAGAGVLGGDRTEINGIPNDNNKRNYGWGIGMGVPVSRTLGLKLTYVGTRTGVSTSGDADTLMAALTVLW